jgi:exosome complex component CSL4
LCLSLIGRKIICLLPNVWADPSMVIVGMAGAVCVVPGQRIGMISEYEAGFGSYVRGNYIYSALAGYKRDITFPEESGAEVRCAITSSLSMLTPQHLKVRPSLVVSRQREIGEVPVIGSIVTCQVIRINNRMANMKIICCNEKVLREGYSGVIR